MISFHFLPLFLISFSHFFFSFFFFFFLDQWSWPSLESSWCPLRRLHHPLQGGTETGIGRGRCRREWKCSNLFNIRDRDRGRGRVAVIAAATAIPLLCCSVKSLNFTQTPPSPSLSAPSLTRHTHSNTTPQVWVSTHHDPTAGRTLDQRFVECVRRPQGLFPPPNQIPYRVQGLLLPQRIRLNF